MTDINKMIMEKAHGVPQLNPDEQRKFLETFAERVIATASLEETESPQLKTQFSAILKKIAEQYEPIFVKISPNLENSLQIYYMKVAQEIGCTATIVSANCETSPFGLVIHTDHAINLEQTDIFKEFTDLLHIENEPIKEKKESFWKRIFG